jgi:hypothetical protein
MACDHLFIRDGRILRCAYCGAVELLNANYADGEVERALARYDEILALERVGHVRNIDRTGREVTYERKSFDGPKAAWTSGKEIL